MYKLGEMAVRRCPASTLIAHFFQTLAHHSLAPELVVVAGHADRYGRRQCKGSVDEVIARREAEVLPSALPAAALVPGWKRDLPAGTSLTADTGRTVRERVHVLRKHKRKTGRQR